MSDSINDLTITQKDFKKATFRAFHDGFDAGAEIERDRILKLLKDLEEVTGYSSLKLTTISELIKERKRKSEI